MSDTRVRVSLAGKTVRLDQLAAEVGAALVASDTEVVVADEASPVTAAALQAALDAHTPAAPEPSLFERLTTIEGEVRGMQERAAIEAAKTLPDAKAVAQAVAGI